VHIFDAHDPYAPKEPYNELFERTDEYPSITSLDLFDANQKSKQDPEQMEVYRLRYDQQLTQTDDYLVKFLKAIPAETLKNTVVILASDHGTAFGEHDKVRHGNNRLFQEEMHIPLMMRIPGVSPRRIVEPVSLLDMTPTILSLMRIPVSKTFIGESLIPLIDGESFGERTIPAVTGMTFFLPQPVKKQPPKNLEEAGALGADRSIIIPRAFGVRKGKTKLFEVVDPKEYAGFYWYDLETDPGEENNLAKNTENQLPRDLVQAIEKLKVSVKPQ
jgi:arylsulfatase A-like enzyme